MPVLDIVAPTVPARAFGPTTARGRALGGSEAAIVAVAPRLAARGWQVAVWTYLDCDPCERDGVSWRDPIRGSQPFDPRAARDALLLWRCPRMIEHIVAENAVGALVLWMHDPDESPWITAADLVLPVSRCHQQQLASANPVARYHPVQNGIDPSCFPAPDESARDPHLAVYCSQPNRGLIRLLRLWPHVRVLVPDARLDIYGGDAALRTATEGTANQALIARMLDTLKLALAELARHGVTHRGPVPPAQVHDALRRAGVWAYPCPPSGVETSCIVSMEAQACGAWPVVTDAGALAETTLAGTILPADAADPEFAEAIAQAMLHPADPSRRAAIREQSLARYDWDVAADMIDAALRSVIGTPDTTHRTPTCTPPPPA